MKNLKVYLVRFFSVRLFLFFAVFFLFMSLSAQVQRMGIAEGKYQLKGGETLRIEAFCMDFTRTPPGAMDYYKFVLNPQSKAIVIVGNKEFSLQDAINKKHIEITGKKLSLEEYMQYLENAQSRPDISEQEKLQYRQIINIWKKSDENSRKELSKLIRLTTLIESGFLEKPDNPNYLLYPLMTSWKFLPDSIKAIFDEAYDSLFAANIRSSIQDHLGKFTDYSKLELINLTREPIEIDFQNNIFVGVSDEKSQWMQEIFSDINLKEENQNSVWNIEVDAKRKVLDYLDFYNDYEKGDTKEKFSKAIKAFQKSKNLEQSGKLDEMTETELYKEFLKMKEKIDIKEE